MEKVGEEDSVNNHLPKATRNIQGVKVGYVTCCTKAECIPQRTTEGLGKREFHGA